MSGTKYIKKISMWPAAIKINESSFLFAEKVAKALLDKQPPALIKSVETTAKEILNEFKNECGQAPSGLQFERVEAWQCFSFTHNNLEILHDIILMDKLFKEDARNQDIALACFILNTPQEPQNFDAVTEAAQRIALKALGVKNDKEGTKRKKAGQKYGSKRSAEVRAKNSKEKDAKIIKWIVALYKQNRKRPQIKEVMKACSIGRTKASTLLQEALPRANPHPRIRK